MHNSIKATTLWLMLGYSAPAVASHFTESHELATAVVNDFNTCPDHQALDAWLGDDLNNMAAATNFMHHYWHITFNVCGADNGKPTPEFRNAVAQVAEEYRLCLQAIINEISRMP